MLATIGLSFGLSIVSATTGRAQVTFQWPEQPPDISTYTDIESCLGLIHERVGFVTRQRFRLQQRDTVPVALRKIDNTYDPVVADVARLCGTSIVVDRVFSQDTLYPREMVNAYQFLSYAGRTEDAQAFGQRWLAAIPASDDTARVVALSSLAAAALATKPARIDEAWQYISTLDITKFWGAGVSSMGSLMLTSIRVQDTTMARKAAQWLVDVPEILPEGVTASKEWQHPVFGAGHVVLAAATYLANDALFDSLSVSTDAYLTYLARLRTNARLGPDVAKREALPLNGDSWFPYKPTTLPPTRGKISIVLTSRDNECADICLGPIAMVRRLSERFPEVEWTFLAYTKGYYGMVIEPPTPEQEAVLIDSVYRRWHGLPATTVVYHTRFWRIPGPDRRRINERSPLEEQYERGGVYIVDRNGTLVTKMSWVPEAEERVTQFIEALMRQPGSSHGQ